jgi:hypothetical protein
MTEESLRDFVDQLNQNLGFRARVQQDAASALAEFGFSPAEQVALASNDEDALRRLPGAEVQESVAAKCLWSWITRHLCTWAFCGPPGTRDWQCPKKPGD